MLEILVETQKVKDKEVSTSMGLPTDCVCPRLTLRDNWFTPIVSHFVYKTIAYHHRKGTYHKVPAFMYKVLRVFGYKHLPNVHNGYLQGNPDLTYSYCSTLDKYIQRPVVFVDTYFLVFDTKAEGFKLKYKDVYFLVGKTYPYKKNVGFTFVLLDVDKTNNWTNKIIVEDYIRHKGRWIYNTYMCLVSKNTKISLVDASFVLKDREKILLKTFNGSKYLKLTKTEHIPYFK